MTKAATAIIGIFVFLAVFGPLVAPYHPKADTDAPLQAPTGKHLLGTDDVGRDIFSQVVVGSRVSLLVGITAALAATLVGLLFGLAAGYFGGWVDTIIMRLVDVFLALPRLPLLILFAAYLGAGIWVLVTVFVVISWAIPARVIRGQVLREKERLYVASAKLSGGSSFYIIRRHILPELGPIVSALVIMEASHAIMAEAGLSFLGLGDPTYISWGTILHYAFVYPALFLGNHWLWWALPAGVCLSLLLVAFAFISMAIEEKLDPRLRGRNVTT